MYPPNCQAGPSHQPFGFGTSRNATDISAPGPSGLGYRADVAQCPSVFRFGAGSGPPRSDELMDRSNPFGPSTSSSFGQPSTSTPFGQSNPPLTSIQLGQLPSSSTTSIPFTPFAQQSTAQTFTPTQMTRQNQFQETEIHTAIGTMLADEAMRTGDLSNIRTWGRYARCPRPTSPPVYMDTSEDDKERGGLFARFAAHLPFWKAREEKSAEELRWEYYKAVSSGEAGHSSLWGIPSSLLSFWGTTPTTTASTSTRAFGQQRSASFSSQSFGQKKSASSKGFSQQHAVSFSSQGFKQQRPPSFGSQGFGQKQPALFDSQDSGQQQSTLFGSQGFGQQQPGLFSSQNLEQQQPASFSSQRFGQQQPALFDSRSFRQQETTLFGSHGSEHQQPGLFGPQGSGQQQPALFSPQDSGQQQPALFGSQGSGQQQPALFGSQSSGQQPAMFGSQGFGQQQLALFGSQDSGQQQPALFSSQGFGQQQRASFALQDSGQQQPILFRSQESGQQQPVLLGSQDSRQQQPVLFGSQSFGHDSFGSQGYSPQQSASFGSQGFGQQQSASFASQSFAIQQSTSFTSPDFGQQQPASFGSQGFTQQQPVSFALQGLGQQQPANFALQSVGQQQPACFDSQGFSQQQSISFASQDFGQQQFTSFGAQSFGEQQSASFGSQGQQQFVSFGSQGFGQQQSGLQQPSDFGQQQHGFGQIDNYGFNQQQANFPVFRQQQIDTQATGTSHGCLNDFANTAITMQFPQQTPHVDEAIFPQQAISVPQQPPQSSYFSEQQSPFGGALQPSFPSAEPTCSVGAPIFATQPTHEQNIFGPPSMITPPTYHIPSQPIQQPEPQFFREILSDEHKIALQLTDHLGTNLSVVRTTTVEHLTLRRTANPVDVERLLAPAPTISAYYPTKFNVLPAAFKRHSVFDALQGEIDACRKVQLVHQKRLILKKKDVEPIPKYVGEDLEDLPATQPQPISEEAIPRQPSQESIQQVFHPISASSSSIQSSAISKKRSPKKTSRKITLKRQLYYTIPSITELEAWRKRHGKCLVKGFTVGRMGYGKVYFPDKVDVSNLNLDEIVHIRYREVTLYPDESKKPPVGQGLNRRAIVTFDSVYPFMHGRSVKEPDDTLLSCFTEQLLEVCEEKDMKFLEYRVATGSFVFEVKHFSGYTLVSLVDDMAMLTLNE